MFLNRKILITTKHKKELVIGPIIEKELGLSYVVNEQYDTDLLGTFTGEIERILDPIDNARKKCLDGMNLYNCEIGIASEGSFGPHPQAYFLSANEEVIIFIDKKNKLEIIAREISTETNFNSKTIQNIEELFAFAESVNFPSHALILRKSKHEKEDIFKGIQDNHELIKTFNYLHKKYQIVFAETDMRAMVNPMRMKLIEKTTLQLIQKIKSTCPNCQHPGFSVTKTKKGLKCNLCGTPTNSPLSLVSVCTQCSFEKEEFYPNNKTSEDPMYCDHCNP